MHLSLTVEEGIYYFMANKLIKTLRRVHREEMYDALNYLDNLRMFMVMA